MSHFTVLVIGEDVDTQLYPFSEGLEVAPYPAMTRESCKEERQKIISSSDVWREEYVEKVRNMTDEEFFQYQAEGYDSYDKDGNPLSTYNPKSKWDWYQIGGRWAGKLLLKEEFKDEAVIPDFSWGWTKEDKAKVLKEHRTDSAIISHLDFDAMNVEQAKMLGEKYDEFIARTSSYPDYKKEYALAHTREEYIEKYTYCPISTYAVLKDGEWYEKGEMGWFGMATNEMSEEEWENKFKELIDSLPKDTLITVVDCHI